jgi:hypothetical protein
MLIQEKAPSSIDTTLSSGTATIMPVYTLKKSAICTPYPILVD